MTANDEHSDEQSVSNLKMFTSGIKSNQRCNGQKTTPLADQILSAKSSCNSNFGVRNRISGRCTYNNGKQSDRTYFKDPVLLSNTMFNSNSLYAKVKSEPEDYDFKSRITAHSIIDISEISVKPEIPPSVPKSRSCGNTRNEVIQRISIDIHNHYQKHWFSASLEKFKLEDRSREERIEITRHEFRRYIQQIVRSNVGKPNRLHNLPDPEARGGTAAAAARAARGRHQAGYTRLVAPGICEVNKCSRPALPCTKHCTLHIMLNPEQMLFEYCTAKFADNTQCSTPVFDISHEIPLCAEHARKRDNYKLYQEAKPKKLRKKVKPSAMIRPQKRNKKRKKIANKSSESPVSSAILHIPATTTSSGSDVGDMIEADSPELEVEDMHMVDQVLGLNENGLEQALATQAHLLEETDISTVLSTIQVDEFSDFFAVNRNGEYEPSREEAEELEKALAEVDNDVKSLEKLSQTQGLLDSLLDETNLAETLVQIPEMFHNGYMACGDSVVAQSSYLLPVEPHSRS